MGFPTEYLAQLDQANEIISKVKSSLIAAAAHQHQLSKNIDTINNSNINIDEANQNELEAYVSSKFIDWLVQTNKIQQVLDLIRYPIYYIYDNF